MRAMQFHTRKCSVTKLAAIPGPSTTPSMSNSRSSTRTPSGESQDLEGFDTECLLPMVDEKSTMPDEAALEMCVRWREKYRVPGSHIQSIKDDVQHLMLQRITAQLQEKLQQKVDDATLATVQDALKEAHLLFHNIQTTKQEKKWSQVVFDPAPVHVRELGHGFRERPTQNGIKRVRCADIVVDVLMEDQLERQIYSKELCDALIQDKRSSDPDLICDIHDGTVYRNHPLFGGTHTGDTIALAAYGDEFQIENAIGPFSGNQKFTLYYGINYNLPKDVRWDLCNIMLLSITLSKTVKLCGQKAVFHGVGDDTSPGGSLRRGVEGKVCNISHWWHKSKWDVCAL